VFNTELCRDEEPLSLISVDAALRSQRLERVSSRRALVSIVSKEKT